MAGGERQSVGEEPMLLTDKDDVAQRESENALRQTDAVLDLIDEVARDGRKFRLKPSTILQLHKLAMDGLSRLAGTWRPGPVSITQSEHKPPHESQVALLIEEMCDWVNDNWEIETALSLCAYVMWRLNWIHPFDDGNGRTSRATSYLVLCARLGDRLPGTLTIPEQIAEERAPYYEALVAIDKAWDEERLDLNAMIELLQHYMAVQLADAYSRAGGERA